ncbi:DUF3592 domain-containing protein [Arthrobacter sp. CDRTa11]|nr:DUF3592 domain-containing protein [Arthrobacter sp. CDRTa11]
MMVLFLGIGPALIVVGTVLADADDELARTGEQVSGTIVRFVDTNKASDRNIRVEYQSADGEFRYVSASVDHDQEPVVGDEVTVVYQADQPGRATVLGFESGGVSVRGIGVLLMFIFDGLALAVTIGGMFRRRSRKRKAAAVERERIHHG